MSDEKVATPKTGLYLCRRASDCVSKPCDDAFEIVIVCVDVRETDDPKTLFEGEEAWYSEGTNHRLENGKIKRDMGLKKEWAVQVTDVQSFVNKYGQCIVIQKSDGFYEILIYDDYVE